MTTTLTYSPGVLQNAVKAALSVVPKRPAMPVRGAVRLDGRTVQATDLDTWVTASALGAWTGAPFPAPLLVDAKALGAALKGTTSTVTVAPDGAVTVDGVTTHPLRFDPQDWPIAPPRPPVEAGALDATDLLEAFAECVAFTSVDETRYVLNGVHVAHGTASATDGHRLHQIPCAWMGPSVLIPRGATRALAQMARAGGSPTACVHDGRLRVWGNGVTVDVRLIDGRFPDVTQVIPSPSLGTCVVHVDRVAWLKALRVMPAPTQVNAAVTLSGLEGGASSVTASVPQYERIKKGAKVDWASIPNSTAGTTGLPCAVTGVMTPRHRDAAPDTRVGVARDYLVDALAALPGASVRIEMLDPLSPLRITSPDAPGTVHVIMPVRI